MAKKGERASARGYMYPSDLRQLSVEAAERGPGVIPADIIHEMIEQRKKVRKVQH